jgi:hypothetical protein
MANEGKDIKGAKERGEWAELRFMARAAEHGLIVTKPWGESSHYDFVVDNRGRLLRVQVKSTICKKNNSYPLNLHGAQAPYREGDFDFVAAYVIPLDLWYIIPAEAALTGRDKLYVTPGSPKTRYERYREAWHLLQGKSAPESNPGTETAGDPEHADQSDGQTPDEAEKPSTPYRALETMLRGIKWSPIHPHFRPRR